jgi:ketosteroid isomerase-like protein
VIEAAAAVYTQTAIVVDEDGEQVEGRAAVRAKYAASFADSPGSKIATHPDSLCFLEPETTLEEGCTTV